MIKMSSLKEKNEKELREMINTLKQELLALRFQAAVGQIEKPSKINEVKKDIARIFTQIASLKTKEGRK